MSRLLSLLLLLTCGVAIDAHPGGRNSQGCHVCRSNCDQHGVAHDERHCHSGGAVYSEPALVPAVPEILRIDYNAGFTLWIACLLRAAVQFRYNVQRDQGDSPRRSSFFIDPDVPYRCQQLSTESYRRDAAARPIYDRGHLVPANHMDQNDEAIGQTFRMTNILPQVLQMNRGAWKRTEDIIECYRDIDELLVIGGVIWLNNASEDHFVGSHGIRTPSAFWKLVVRGQDRAIAWLIPNASEATHNALDNYLVTVSELETLTGQTFPVAEFRKDELLTQSWPIPIGCDRS